MINSGLFMSATDDWSTPQHVFDELNTKHGPFTLDVAASPSNAKCSQFFVKDELGGG